MKKILTSLLALTLLAGCSGDEIDNALSVGETDTPQTVETVESVSPVIEETETVQPDETVDENETSATEGNVVEPDEEGSAYGYMGDTMRTAFLDFVVEDAYTTHEFDGFTPAEGNKYVVVTINIINTQLTTLPMFDDDFELTWNINTTNTDIESVYPVSVLVGEDPSAYESYETLSDLQLPITYEIPIGESKEGILLFEVPDDAVDYLMAFVEYYTTGETGNSYFVAFNAVEE